MRLALCISDQDQPAPPFHTARIIALSVSDGSRNSPQLATAATNGIKTSRQASQKANP
jgi:hypothetical protein